jgi:multiple sugar transport system substrate-binding protein
MRESDKKLTRREFIKGGVATGLGVIAAGGLSAACAPGATPSPAPEAPTPKAPTRLTLWKGPHSELEEQRFAEYLAPFQEAHPGTTVEFRVTPWETWDEIYTAGFAGGEPPDVWYAPGILMFKFADAGQLLDLGPYVNDPTWASEKAGFQDFIWPQGQWQGTQYTVPFLQGSVDIYFNVEMFDAAGIDYPPATYEEFVEAAKALTVPGEAWGFTTPLQNVDTPEYFNMQWMWQCGADYLNEDMTGPGYDNECGLSVVQFFTDLVCKHKVTPPAASYNRFGLVDLFKGGKVAMCQDELTQHAQWKASGDLPAFEYDVGIQPPGPAGQYWLTGVGSWSISKACKHQDEAWELVKFLTTADFQKRYCEDHSFMPVRTDIKDIFADDPIMRKAVTQRPGEGRGYQNHLKIREVSRVMWLPLEKAFNCEAKPEDALKESADMVRDVLAE